MTIRFAKHTAAATAVLALALWIPVDADAQGKTPRQRELDAARRRRGRAVPARKRPGMPPTPAAGAKTNGDKKTLPGEAAFNECLRIPARRRIKVTLKPESSLKDLVAHHTRQALQGSSPEILARHLPVEVAVDDIVIGAARAAHGDRADQEEQRKVRVVPAKAIPNGGQGNALKTGDRQQPEPRRAIIARQTQEGADARRHPVDPGFHSGIRDAAIRGESHRAQC